MKTRITSLIILLIAVALAFFVLSPEKFDESGDSLSKYPFEFGLDLVGGSHLVYKADISELDPAEVAESMQALQGVLEKRLNPVGTSEVQVRTEGASVFAENSDKEQRVIIEIPGVTDPEEAKQLIGLIPLLEFKLPVSQVAYDALLTEKTPEELTEADLYVATELTGRYIEGSTVGQDHLSGQTVVNLRFNSQGRDLFADLTKENVGQVMAIFLDGEVISAPVIRQEIFDGNAQISGDFGLEEAQTLARNLNYGALPVPIEPISTQSISPSLGQDVLNASVKAAVLGIIIVMIFLVLIYRIGGLIASLSLAIYVILLLSLFKVSGFVFTAAGIAGFIISIGMAVDANVLIFERVREELSFGKKINQAIDDGFARAWLSIRDSNLSSIITAIILFYLTTSLVQGFALAFGLGVVVSMFTAITITRTLLKSLSGSSKTFRKNFVGRLPVISNKK